MDCVLIVAIILFILLISSGIREMYRETVDREYTGERSITFKLGDGEGVEECKTECSASSNCHGFVHNTETKTCTIIEGTITRNNTKFNSANNTLYEKDKKNTFKKITSEIVPGGATIPDKKINTLRMCRRYCKEDPNCGGFRFNRKTKDCFFKKNIRPIRDGMIVIEKKVSA